MQIPATAPAVTKTKRHNSKVFYLHVHVNSKQHNLFIYHIILLIVVLGRGLF